ncbi:NAD(P)H-binding protein [Candidatus Marinimicrobia bacterium]|nr:NAD(P)H-binding protein [Candidatus Neomarinimicrobiota bacterium]
MKVALIGGTGYVGSYITDELIKNGMIPRILVREGSQSKLLQPNKCELVLGDVEDEEALRQTLSGCDAVIYLIALIREFPSENITNERFQFKGSERVSKIAKEVGVKRFLLMSALGANPNPESSNYMNAKYLSEQSLKNTDLEWTIIRPSSLFGDPRGGGRPEFCMMLDKLMLNLLPFPNFLPFPAPAFFTGLNPLDAGNYSLSMIHAKDVATVFIKSLEDKTTISQTIELGGEKEVTWNEIVTSIASVTGQKIIMVPAPFGVVATIAGLFDRFSWFPAGREQLEDLVKGNVCDSSTIFKRYQIDRIPFNIENLFYLNKKGQ